MTRDSSSEVKRPTRGSSFFSGRPQVQLRTALLSHDINTFKKLITGGLVDPEHVYDHPDYKTCLEIAISEPNRQEFIEYLLEQKVLPLSESNLNKINETYGFAPIHFAVDSGNIKALQTLLDDDRVDVNVKSDGNTALLMAIKKMEDLDNDCEQELIIYENMIEILLKKGCNVNSPDLKGVTPIYSASKQGLKTVITLIADYAKKPVDIDSFRDRNQKSARDYLKAAFPLLVDKFGSEEIDINVDKLFYYLSKEDEDNFIRGVKQLTAKNESNSVLNENNGANTLLQFATEKGMEKAVVTLLTHGADPNLTFSGNPSKPVAIACQYGYENILKMFIDKESIFDSGTGDSLLQIIIKGMRMYHQSDKANHKGCLKLLFDNKSKININVNHPDMKQNTALHYAARNGDQEIVMELLRNGACVALRNKFNEPPLADINAKTLESYLDECITTNEVRPSDENYEIHMEYKFLVYPNNSIENETCKVPLMDNCNNNIKQCDTILASETDALLYMTRNQELRPLLKHPVITSFLYLKWQRISCLFYANITFYSLLWLSLILYVTLGYGVEKKQSDAIEVLNVITHIGTIVGLILLLLRELFQLLVSPTKYLQSIENLIEIILIFVTVAIVCSDSAQESTKQQLSAVAILLSSAELVLLIGQFPTLSTYIVMLRTVSWNFLEFLLWYCILIIAFALSFYTLFRKVEEEDQIAPNPNNVGKEDEEEDFFEDPGRSLFKTIVMLTGEFDAGSIKFRTFPVTSHLIFIVFVFMIPIVLFNLLNGLAVSDTQEIRRNAELVGHVSRVKLISYFESVLIGSTMGSNSRQSWCCSCLPSYIQNLNIIKPKMLCLRFLATRISLFPTFLPQYKIIVKPNQENKIEIPQEDSIIKYGDDEDIEQGSSCCFERCQNYRLDPDIVKQSRAIVSKKTTITEFDEIKNKLSEYEKKFDNLENWLKKALASNSYHN